MTDETEGLLVASSCMINTLMTHLIRKQLFSPEDVADVMGDAEEFLAGMAPQLMTPGARDYARRVIQESAKIFRPPS